MKRSYEKKRPTRELIMQAGMRMFLEEGYHATTCTRIAKQLNISPGNMTFYFPTKEHLLAELVEQLCDFQWKVMEDMAMDGQSSLYAYCMELATMAALCDSSTTARDFYLATYTHPMTLAIIRKNDTQKAKAIFGRYAPHFDDSDFVCAENLASGMEYATLATPSDETVPLDKKVSSALNSIMMLYGVPEDLRRETIEKVMGSGYQGQGKDLLGEFIAFTEKVNAQAVEHAREYKLHH